LVSNLTKPFQCMRQWIVILKGVNSNAFILILLTCWPADIVILRALPVSRLRHVGLCFEYMLYYFIWTLGLMSSHKVTCGWTLLAVSTAVAVAANSQPCWLMLMQAYILWELIKLTGTELKAWLEAWWILGGTNKNIWLWLLTLESPIVSLQWHHPRPWLRE